MKLYATALVALLPSFAAAPDMIKGNAFGNPSAPIMIEIFSDFQCPSCKRFHDEELSALRKEYVETGKAYLIYRYFPLQQHQYARKAAELVCACAQMGKYEPAADILFARQEAWSQDGKVAETIASVLSPAEQRKLPMLLQDPSVQEPINHDLDEGRALPVTGTPFMLITFKSKQYKLTGPGLANYTWVKATLDALR
jgi:protein-disulfide isomerase